MSFAEFEGFYWHFMYDLAGRIVEWRVLPFESCRLGKPDDSGWINFIHYNPFFGTGEYASGRKKDTIKYYSYNPASVTAQIAKEKDKYTGQVLFVGTTTATSRFYPLPEATSAQPWMRSEAGIADYHEENINNGLLQPYILVMKGNPNDPSTNPAYNDVTPPVTIAQEFNDVIAKNFMGARRVGNVWVQWVNIGAQEETPEVVALPSNANSDLFINIDNQATKNITVAFKVPAILANINEGVSLGGDGNMVRVAVKLMQQRVVKKQRTLTDAYQTVLRKNAKPYNEDITIVPYNPYPELEVIDQKVWDALTPEERRKWINENTEITLIEAEPVSAPNEALPQSRMLNAIPVGFPESIRKTVQKALEIEEKRALKCSKPGGRSVADMIVNNQSMSLRQVKRVYNYLKKRPELENGSFDNCEVILYNQWGGKEMEKFLEAKLNEVDAWLN